MTPTTRRKPAAPKRITINGVEINAPLSEEPKCLDFCWFLSGDNQLFGDTWHGFAWQKLMLKEGRCFAYDAMTPIRSASL